MDQGPALRQCPHPSIISMIMTLASALGRGSMSKPVIVVPPQADPTTISQFMICCYFLCLAPCSPLAPAFMMMAESIRIFAAPT